MFKLLPLIFLACFVVNTLGSPEPKLKSERNLNDLDNGDNETQTRPQPQPRPRSNTSAEPPLPASRLKGQSTLLFSHGPLLTTVPVPLSSVQIQAHAGLRTLLTPGTIIVHDPTLAQVGEIVHDIPTAVSHQSQTVVHNRARLITPIVAPVVHTRLLHAYNAPLVYSTAYVSAKQSSKY